MKMPLSLVEKNDGQQVDAHAGETITITLSENATTGYRWAIDHYDASMLEALGEQSLYPQENVGSGGQVAFLFRTTKSGSSELALKYWRRWEGDGSIVRRFRVRVNVLP